MEKFKQVLNLANKEIKSNRASLIYEDAKDAMEDAVREKQKAKREIEKQILSLSDIHPESKLSLLVGKPNFNAKEWVQQMQALKLQLTMADVELTIAQGLQNDWFADQPVKENTDAGLSKQE